MTEKTFLYVRHEDTQAYIELGWTNHPNSLKGTHHGEFSTLMEWTRGGEPARPCEGEAD